LRASRRETRSGLPAQTVDESDSVILFAFGLVYQGLNARADFLGLVTIAWNDGHIHDVGGTRGRAVRRAGEGFAGEDEETHGYQ